ncbi:hypothetical protein ACLI09_09395 [Flavobacterium sp. RHBU_24]|uniref:hypothetical protein n=1 Tax=Flavobacterium sp. RHBU_24 TaxID=3391185 RepID=UPI003984648B
MGLFTDVFERSKKHKEIISVRCYKDDEGFWAGYVQDYTDDIISLKHYTKYGKPDGVIILNISDIKSIDFDDDYSRAMQCVIDYSAEIDKEMPLDVDIPTSELWQFSLLKYAENNKELVAKVEINNGDLYSGFVEQVSEDDVILHFVGNLGESEGRGIYRIEDITAVRLNDVESRKRLMLFKWRQAKL